MIYFENAFLLVAENIMDCSARTRRKDDDTVDHAQAQTYYLGPTYLLSMYQLLCIVPTIHQ